MGFTYAELTDTPVGPISFFAGENGLQCVAYAPLKELKASQPFLEEKPSLKGLETVGTLLVEINEYLFGIRKSFSVEIDWDILSSFQREVLRLTADIPFGGIRTYGGLASQLGKPGAARAVGTALGDNPMPIVIPCHRVVGSDLRLRGYAAPGGIMMKAFLLELEGHTLDGDRIVKK